MLTLPFSVSHQRIKRAWRKGVNVVVKLLLFVTMCIDTVLETT